MSARILDVSPEEYFELEAFSASAAKVLIAKSPAHAKAENNRKPSKALDAGNVIHRLVLGKGKDYRVLQHSSYNTKAAKEDRDRARAEGLVPVLAEDFERYCTAAERIRVQLADRGIVLDGESELAVAWDEETPHGIVACRGMMDHVWLDRGIILDLKTTADAAPASVERTAENLGYAIQAAAYTRALAKLRPELAGRVRFLFAFAEYADEPFALNLCEPSGVFMELGERRWMRAVSAWGECIKNNHWPSYGDGINHLYPPPWALSREGYTADEL